MNNLFSIVYRTLTWIANITGLTYEEVNIVVYFYFLPALFLYLLSKRTNNTLPLKLFTIVCLFSLFIIPDFEKFSNGLDDAIAKIKELKAEQGEEIVEKVATEFSDVSFDDLGTDSAE